LIDGTASNPAAFPGASVKMAALARGFAPRLGLQIVLRHPLNGMRRLWQSPSRECGRPLFFKTNGENILTTKFTKYTK